MKLKYYMRGLGFGIVFTVLVYTLTGRNGTMTEEEIKAEAKKLGMVEASSEVGLLDKIQGNAENTPSKEPENETLIPTPTIPPQTQVTVTPSAPTELPEPTNPTPTKEPELIPTKEPTQSLVPTPTKEPTPTNTPIPTKKPAATSTPKPTKRPEVTTPPEPTKLPPDSGSSQENDNSKTENQTGEQDNPDSSSGTGQEAANPTVPPIEPETSDTEEVYVYLTVSKGMNSNQIAALAEKKGLVSDAVKFDQYLMSNGYADRIRINTYQIRIGASFQEIAECLVTLQPWRDPVN